MSQQLTYQPLKKPILWVSFGPIGDTVIMLALFDDILKRAPGTRFTIITSTNAAIIRDIVSAYPTVEVRDIPSSPLKLLGFLAFIFSKRWNVLVPGTARAYSLHIKLFFMALSALPGNRTIGYGDVRKSSGWLPFRTGLYFDRSISILDNYRRLAQPLLIGEAMSGKPAHAVIDTERPSGFPFKDRGYFAMHLFGTRARLSFPPQRWKTILCELRSSHPDRGIVLTGGKKDEELLKTVSAGISDVQIFINRPIHEVAWIVTNAAVYIGVDTGVTHIASILNAPAVVIGNNSNPMWMPYYNPKGVVLMNTARCVCTGDMGGDCRVYEDGVGYLRCTYDIDPGTLYRAIDEKLRAQA